ncbi:hypothetical protein Tco_1034965 [Tanacetum coccineum]
MDILRTRLHVKMKVLRDLKKMMILGLKASQRPFSWGLAVGGEGTCPELSLPNADILLRNDKKGQTALHVAAKGQNYDAGEHGFAYSSA